MPGLEGGLSLTLFMAGIPGQAPSGALLMVFALDPDSQSSDLDLSATLLSLDKVLDLFVPQFPYT